MRSEVKPEYRPALGCQMALAIYMQLISWVYARAFAESTPILPRWGNHLPPDAAHFVLQVLLLSTVATGAMAVLRQKRR